MRDRRRKRCGTAARRSADGPERQAHTTAGDRLPLVRQVLNDPQGNPRRLDSPIRLHLPVPLKFILTIRPNLIKQIAMMKNPDVEIWVDLSKAFFRELLPKGAGFEMCGKGMDPNDFAALVDRESPRVDHALVAMALAADEIELKHLVSQLSRDTLICLFSRWAHYIREWEARLYDPDPHLWLPPNGRDIWRAILLAMTGENLHSTEAAHLLWPEFF